MREESNRTYDRNQSSRGASSTGTRSALASENSKNKQNAKLPSDSALKKSFSIKLPPNINQQSFTGLSQHSMQGSQHSVEGSHIETKSSKTSIARQNDTSKEARRNIDGTPFILEDDDEDEEGLMMSPRFLDDFAEPSAFLGMSSQLSVARRSTNTSQSMIWQSQSQVKHTVEEHEKRLAIRHEVLSQLALWVSQVEEERGSPLPSALGGGLDFLGAADLSDGEDVDEETRRRKKKEEKPDPRGLGATLRAHFQACVQEEAKKVVDSVRKDWERERQMEVDELSSLRIHVKTLKASLEEMKSSYEKVSGKAELLERQVKSQSQEQSVNPADAPWVQGRAASSDSSAELAEMKIALEASRLEIRGLLGQLGASEGAKKSLEKSLSEAKEAMASVSLNEEVQQLRKELEESKGENAALEAKVESLVAELWSLQESPRGDEDEDVKGSLVPPLLLNDKRTTSTSMTPRPSKQNTPRPSEQVAQLKAKVAELEEMVSRLRQDLSDSREEANMLRAANSEMDVEDKLVLEREVASSLGAEANVVLQEAKKKLQEMASSDQLPSSLAAGMARKRGIFDENELQSLLEESAMNMRKLLEMGGFPLTIETASTSVEHLDLDEFSPRLRTIAQKASVYRSIPSLRIGKGQKASESAPNTYRGSQSLPGPPVPHPAPSLAAPPHESTTLPSASATASPSSTPRQTAGESSSSQGLIRISQSSIRPQTAPYQRPSSSSSRSQTQALAQAPPPPSSCPQTPPHVQEVEVMAQYLPKDPPIPLPPPPTMHDGPPLVQVTRLGSPPPLRHGPYSHHSNHNSSLAIQGRSSALAPSRPIQHLSGAFPAHGVRSITATPQKGFMIEGRGTRSASGRPSSARTRSGEGGQGQGQRRTQSPERFLVVDEDGRGLPQLPPGPVSFMSREYHHGTSSHGGVPITTYRFNSPSVGPAGRLLRQAYLSPVHFLEGRSKGQLIQNLSLAQKETEKALAELQSTFIELQRARDVNGELLGEVGMVRQSWVAEREYNALLTDELNKMQAILNFAKAESKSEES